LVRLLGASNNTRNFHKKLKIYCSKVAVSVEYFVCQTVAEGYKRLLYRERFVIKKYISKNSNPNNWERPQHNSSFSNLLDAIDPERDAQRQEHLRRMSEEKGASFSQAAPKAPAQARPKPQPPKKHMHAKKPKAPSKKKGLTFEEKLDITMQWLETTFPDLFDPSQPCKPLDIHIVRDVKNHYKLYAVKNRYPNDLVIKAALYRYMETPEYIECLEKGAPRYNIENEVVDHV
jgi:hypothetical protein